MKVMVDLFCGRGGWTKGFQAYGWRCVGIDLYPQPEYPGEFIQADITHLYELPEADFYCCSSPCEQFSLHNMKHFHPNPKWPWLGIALFEHARNLILATGKPYVMENVRAAERFVGRATNHCGPFYLWGTGVPAIWPRECFSVIKGAVMGSGQDFSRMTPEEKREHRRLYPLIQTSSKSKARKALTAMFAEIPQEIANHVAQIAEISLDTSRATGVQQ